MLINKLNNAQLELFSKNAAATHTCLGGRKFQAAIEIDGKKQKIIASAKAVYRQIEKTGQNQEIFYRFLTVEIKTRDKTVFSKQLNFLQKIYYFIVKALLGLDFKDTWTNKFLGCDLKQAQVPKEFDSKGNYIGLADELTRVIAKKIQNGFKVFNGISCNRVLVDGFGIAVGGSEGLFAPTSSWRLEGYDKPSFNDPNLIQRYEFFRKEILNNPKALIVSLNYDHREKNVKDPTIPEDITCNVYHMNRKEYEALPRVSGKLKKFMSELNSKNSS